MSSSLEVLLLPSAARLWAIFGLGPMELAIVGLVVLLLFGSRLPSVMRSLGTGIVEFKKGVKGIEDVESTPAKDSSKDDSPTAKT
jgi:sec-independent protein translocase protein TatA